MDVAYLWCLMLIAFPRQQWLHERASILRLHVHCCLLLTSTTFIVTVHVLHYNIYKKWVIKMEVVSYFSYPRQPQPVSTMIIVVKFTCVVTVNSKMISTQLCTIEIYTLTYTWFWKMQKRSHKDNIVFVRIYCPPLTEFPQDALKSGKFNSQLYRCTLYRVS